MIGNSHVEIPIKYLSDAIGPAPRRRSIPSEKVDIKKIFEDFSHNFPPHLKWINFYKNGHLTAEVLLSAELIEIAEPSIETQKTEINEAIPKEICPAMKKYRLEAIFIGIRNASNFPCFTSGRYKIELCMGELTLHSGFSGKKLNHNLNFLDPYDFGFMVK